MAVVELLLAQSWPSNGSACHNTLRCYTRYLKKKKNRDVSCCSGKGPVRLTADGCILLFVMQQKWRSEHPCPGYLHNPTSLVALHTISCFLPCFCACALSKEFVTPGEQLDSDLQRACWYLETSRLCVLVLSLGFWESWLRAVLRRLTLWTYE
jgi:hypothetical protein